MHIHILAIEAPLEAQTIRLAAEAWGADVTVTWVGNSRQVVDYFRAGPTPDLLIISAHGDKRGLTLPELASEVRHLYPYHEVITPQDFRSFLPARLPVVVSTGCLGGAPDLANVFLDHGAPAYIGATEYPNASAVLMYTLECIYNYVHRGQDVVTAHQQAAAHDDDRQQFQLYQARTD